MANDWLSTILNVSDWLWRFQSRIAWRCWVFIQFFSLSPAALEVFHRHILIEYFQV